MNALPNINTSFPARLEQRFTSDPVNIAPVRRAVESLAASAGFDDKAVCEIGLCVNEALANVTLHAYDERTDGPVLLTAETAYDGEQGSAASKSFENSAGDGHSPSRVFSVTIRDWGNGVNPATLPIKPQNTLRPGGLGLVCLRQLMDQIVFTPQPDGMLLVMEKRTRG